MRLAEAVRGSITHMVVTSREINYLVKTSATESQHGGRLFDKPQYPTCRAPLAENDLILLFTDGLYEADNGEQEEFGQDRLRAAVRRHQHLPTEQMLDAILRDVQSFSNTRDFDDDVCLVAMTRKKQGPITT